VIVVRGALRLLLLRQPFDCVPTFCDLQFIAGIVMPLLFAVG